MIIKRKTRWLKEVLWQLPWWPSGLGSVLPVQRTWVPDPVREQRPHRQCHKDKVNKKILKNNKRSVHS